MTAIANTVNPTAETTHAVSRFLADYCFMLDDGDTTRWPEYFTEDGVYSLITHESAIETGMHLLVDRGQSALKERSGYVSGYFLVHRRKTMRTLSLIAVLEETDDIVTVRSNLVVYRVGRDGASNLHGTATCHDTIAKTADGLRFVRHHVVLNESLLPGDFSDIL